MRITCPNCATTFKIPDSALGTTGRKLRCSKCEHKWHQDPIAEEPAAKDPGHEEPAPKPAAKPVKKTAPAPAEDNDDLSFADQSNETLGDDEADRIEDHGDRDETDEPIEPIPFATRAALRSAPEPRPSRPYALIGSLTGTVVILSVLLLARGTIVGLWPASARLYDTIGLRVPVVGEEIVIQNVGAWREKQGEVTVLVVRGELRNRSDEVQSIPTLRGAILDASTTVTQDWLFVPEATSLLPGEKVSFETEFPQPPPGGETVRVTFSTQSLQRGGIGY